MYPENVIVTLFVEGGFSADYELPAGVELKQLSGMLLEVLRQQNSKMFSDWTDIALESKGYVLSETDTLASAGIWDGSILRVMEG